ncbi:hypothetical protein ACFOON_08880 [Novosphingobium piscinae]|uniref:Glycosyltransferase family 1 protein n=1 Tax=Novosphingobium piscinae TaxID=1507448 RepID=A0A7X1KQ20_9SPHN|nr:hypothetical protein [Novosphingobium piscinae]MBC2669073.1 hypothetical protein [Novosphingobium piscinae]
MKLQIFVRSATWLETAGTRIRYHRMRAELAQLGCVCSIDPISRVREGLKLGADVYLFSKCHDAGALMMADMLREAGALVGFDLFDDYISNECSLTLSQREFQRSLRGRADFLLCSTPQMVDAVRAYDRDTPVHVLNDPFAPFSLGSLVQTLQDKVQRARSTRCLEIVWFGQAANPLFPVGISDLVSFGQDLGRLGRAGWDARLRVLTNGGALDVETLAGLRRLPLPVEIQEWSLQQESTALDTALLAYIPVNYQPFSVAKSLNRAVTALSHGAQVLSPGFSLYAPLDPFVYAHPDDLLQDLEFRELRLNHATADSLLQAFAGIADPAVEALSLLTFLNGLPLGPLRRPVRQRCQRAILHGAETVPATGSLCRALGWLSWASPFSGLVKPFDAAVTLLEDGAEPAIILSRDAVARLASSWRRLAVPLSAGGVSGFTHRVPLPDSPAGQILANVNAAMLSPGPLRAMHYRSIMAATEAVFKDAFGDTTVIWSELEPYLATAAVAPESAG